MNLSRRLLTAAALVTAGNAVCDVGCDHAYTSIELVRRGAPYAVASDVRPGPLMAARQHVEEAGLSGKICTVLADGVPKDINSLLPEGLAASLVVTGMGGMLIIDILTEAGELLDRFDELILSPQSDIYAVRTYLTEHGYVFADEAEVLEDGKFYTLMKVRTERVSGDKEQRSCDNYRNAGRYSKVQLLYGPCLLDGRDETLHLFLRRRQKVLLNIKDRLTETGRGPDDARYCEIEEELRSIYEAERYYGEAEQ